MRISNEGFVIKEIYNEEEFANIFKVFRGYPYNEKWPDDEIRQVFLELKSNGKVYGYYLNNQCVGLITFYKMIENEHPVNFDKTKKVLYFSDVAVLPEYRNNGIASTLIKFMICYAEVNNYDIIYMRTMQPELSMSYHIVVKLGFNIMNGITENKKMERTNGKTEADARIFLKYDVKGGLNHGWSYPPWN